MKIHNQEFIPFKCSIKQGKHNCGCLNVYFILHLLSSMNSEVSLLVTVQDTQQEDVSVTTLRQSLQLHIQTFSSSLIRYQVQGIHRFGE